MKLNVFLILKKVELRNKIKEKLWWIYILKICSGYLIVEKCKVYSVYCILIWLMVKVLFENKYVFKKIRYGKLIIY